MTKWCPFCLLYNNFFCFLLDRTGWWGSASYMLCFACTGGNALLQASVYFIPNRSHCCTEGIFFLFRVNHAQRKANVQKSTFSRGTVQTAGPGFCGAVDLQIWVLTFLPVHLDKSRDFLSSFKKPFVRITVLLCWQKWERKKKKQKTFKPLKDQIYDRLALVGPGWTVKMLALFIWGEQWNESTLQNWSVASLFSMAQLFNLE